MENNLLENTNTQVAPETEIGAGLVSSAPEIVPHGKTRAPWEDGNKDSGRPPWKLLLLGIAALSVVYWLWGREAREMSLRAATATPTAALMLAVLPTMPTVSLPDGTVLFLTKDVVTNYFTVCDLFVGKSEQTCVSDQS